MLSYKCDPFLFDDLHASDSCPETEDYPTGRDLAERCEWDVMSSLEELDDDALARVRSKCADLLLDRQQHKASTAAPGEELPF